MFLVVLDVNLTLPGSRPAAFAEGFGRPRRSSPDAFAIGGSEGLHYERAAGVKSLL
jgi:hypothetical protein